MKLSVELNCAPNQNTKFFPSLQVVGAGLDSWYKTGIRWIGGRWCRTGFRWYRKIVAGLGLVSASAGRWSLVKDW